MVVNVFTRLKNLLRKCKREHLLKNLKKMNGNHDFCLITNDCVGGVIYHDLGEQFRSPTINLWISNDHFLEFAQNLKYYLSCEITETPDSSKKYPVGTIIPTDDRHIPIVLNFMHYKTFEEAHSKWKERSLRVDYNNLYFIWHFNGEGDIEKVKEFDRWNAKKLVILHNANNDIASSGVVSCYNENPYNGKILEVVERTGKRYLDEIDYISFLNNSRA